MAKLYKTLFVVLAVVLVNFSAKAQLSLDMVKGKSEYASGFVLTLSGAGSLVDEYVADFSHLDFPSAEEAERFFSGVSENLVSFKADFSTKKVGFRLYRSGVYATWTLEDWNSFLAGKAAHYQTVYNQIMKIDN